MKVSELAKDYEFAEIIISGTALNGHTYTQLAGVIGTVSKEQTIKVWPKEDTEFVEDDGGKIWFDNSATIHWVMKDEDLLNW